MEYDFFHMNLLSVYILRCMWMIVWNNIDSNKYRKDVFCCTYKSNCYQFVEHNQSKLNQLIFFLFWNDNRYSLQIITSLIFDSTDGVLKSLHIYISLKKKNQKIENKMLRLRSNKSDVLTLILEIRYKGIDRITTGPH